MSQVYLGEVISIGDNQRGAIDLPSDPTLKICFNTDECKRLTTDGEVIEFVPFRPFEQPLYSVKVGDWVAFKMQNDAYDRSMLASPWTLATTWNAMRAYLANRPTYRLILRRPNEASIELWEGVNIYEVSARFPHEQSFGPSGLQNDSLLEFTPKGTCHFEVRQQGDWVVAKDPRVLACCLPMTMWSRFHANKLQPNCRHPK